MLHPQQNLDGYPNVWAGSQTKKASPFNTQKDQKGAGLTMKPFHPSKSWFIPRISQSGFQNNKKYPKKPCTFDKNSNREKHERMFRFYWHRFGTRLPNVDAWPQNLVSSLEKRLASDMHQQKDQQGLPSRTRSLIVIQT